MTRLVQRANEYRRRHGLLALPRELCLRTYRRLFQNWHYVFACDEPPALCTPPTGLRLLHCREPHGLPDAYREQIVRELSVAMNATLNHDFANRAELFVALDGDQVAAIQWVRFGCHVRSWFVPLRADDFVLFGGTTLPRFRRRGIMTWMIVDQTRYALQRGGRGHSDVKVWNTPAIRAVECAGYRRIACLRPLRAEP